MVTEESFSVLHMGALLNSVLYNSMSKQNRCPKSEERTRAPTQKRGLSGPCKHGSRRLSALLKGIANGTELWKCLRRGRCSAA